MFMTCTEFLMDSGVLDLLNRDHPGSKILVNLMYSMAL